jgi:hypothetical protein
MTLEEFKTILPGGPQTKQRRVLAHIESGRPFNYVSIREYFTSTHQKINYSTIREIVKRFEYLGVVSKGTDGLFMFNVSKYTGGE